jgi:hypothetical protein
MKNLGRKWPRFFINKIIFYFWVKVGAIAVKAGAIADAVFNSQINFTIFASRDY